MFQNILNPPNRKRNKEITDFYKPSKKKKKPEQPPQKNSKESKESEQKQEKIPHYLKYLGLTSVDDLFSDEEEEEIRSDFTQKSADDYFVKNNKTH